MTTATNTDEAHSFQVVQQQNYHSFLLRKRHTATLKTQKQSIQEETNQICAAVAAAIGCVEPPRQCRRHSQLLKSSIRADHTLSAASVRSSQPETSRAVNNSGIRSSRPT
jgi:hypothetical protein